MDQSYSTDTRDAPMDASSQPFDFSQPRVEVFPAPPPSELSPSANPHQIAARGFGQMFGLHPAMAFLTLIVDSMLFTGEVGSLGMSLPISVAVAVIVGCIAYRAQMKWYGDDKESAAIKAGCLALLTAIPTALPAMFYVPAGVVGLVHQLRKRS